MFNNIGGKIKKLAVILTVIEMTASIIAGFVLAEDTEGISLAIAVAVCLIAWISSFVLYGYGQLIYNSDKLVRTYTSNKINDDKNIVNIVQSAQNEEQIENDEKDDYEYNYEYKKSFERDIPTRNYNDYEINELSEKYKISKDLVRDISSTRTTDLILIIKNQKNLYSANEMKFIKDELSQR